MAVQAGVLDPTANAPPPGADLEQLWSRVAIAADLPQSELALLVADYFRLKVAQLGAAEPEAILEVSAEQAWKFCVFPLAQSDRHLVVATPDPTDVEAERALGFGSGKAVEFRVAPPGEIAAAIVERYGPPDDEVGFEQVMEDPLEAVELIHVEDVDDEEFLSIEDIHAAPVVKLTNLIIRDGIRQGASDIHIEPGHGSGKVRFRVDGVLRKYMDVPMSAMMRIVSQIKIRSDMDIADRLRPQDGRTRVNVDRNLYDLRISTIPAGKAEKCVIRILDQNESQTLDDLSIPESELVRIRQLLTFREGIVAVTGPTGSGKTTTLYGALREIADGRVNIMTVEDPIEYSLPSVTQTQVEVRQGMTFASALRAILRQDPDVILIGEIRDTETAGIAAQAAMTGHLVLATVHANDAVGVVPRLLDLGLDHSVVSETLRGAIAQRLLRRVCPDCSEPLVGDLTQDETKLAERYGVRPLVRASGCPECGHTGYRGRLPILEVMAVGPSIEDAISHKKGGATLQSLAVRGGMSTLEQSALAWVEEGLTTLVEVERVVGSNKEMAETRKEQGPPRILVVDDDEDMRLKHRTLLEGEGYQVTEAEDGDRALAVLKDDPDFSLVLLDLKMPGADGLEVLRTIRGRSDTFAIPVMISTGTSGRGTEVELLDAGADDFVHKRAGADKVRARIRAVLRRSGL
ncbi:MAG: Flp pilus assembly complex ATPase component TadA [Gemmatimonadetes bacterium]|nr:Flp pilus assembly complex ATPase component TadA [Gemmatimonadota bacterium]